MVAPLSDAMALLYATSSSFDTLRANLHVDIVAPVCCSLGHAVVVKAQLCAGQDVLSLSLCLQ